MKKSLFLIILCLYCFLGYSQKISFSEELGIHNNISYEIIGTLKNHTLLFHDQDLNYKVQGFDDKMQKVWEKELEFEKRNPKVLSAFAPNEDEFDVFYTHRRKGHPLLKIHKYDATANLIDSLTIKDFGLKSYTPSFDVVFSEDKTKVLFFHLEDSEIMNALVFDILKMETLWDYEFKDIDTDYGNDIYELLVSNEGEFNVVMVRNNFTSKNKPHQYEHFSFGSTSTSPNSQIINIEEKLTYDARFSLDNMNGGLVGGGLYSQKNRSKAVGYFYLNIPKNNSEEYLLTYHPFDDDFVAEYLDRMDEKNQKKNKGIFDTVIKELVLRRDGGILMIGERSKDTERNTGPNSQAHFSRYGRFVEDHYYDDLFVISIHPNGEEHWKKILHKKQYSYDDGGVYSSYFLIKTPSSLRLLFNDEVKEENTVSEYILRGNGNYERKSIMNTQNQNLRLRFKDSIQIGSGVVIVPSERRRRLRLVKMEF